MCKIYGFQLRNYALSLREAWIDLRRVEQSGKNPQEVKCPEKQMKSGYDYVVT